MSRLSDGERQWTIVFADSTRLKNIILKLAKTGRVSERSWRELVKARLAEIEKDRKAAGMLPPPGPWHVDRSPYCQAIALEGVDQDIRASAVLLRVPKAKRLGRIKKWAREIVAGRE